MTRRLLPIIVCLLPSLIVLACEEEPPAARLRPVRSVVVGDVLGFQASTLPGRAKATQEVDMAFEVSGQLVERPVKVGDRVVPGQILARLDPRDYQNALDASKAERKRAKAFYDRVAEAARTGAVSRQDLSDARARYDQAESLVNIRQKAVDDSHLVAPFAGTVSTTYVDNFQNVRAKQPVIRLLDVSKMEMTIDVPEGDIGLVPYVKDVIVRFDALPDREFHASIEEVSTEASRSTRTYPVTLIIEPPEDGAILAGMAGTASAVVDLPEDLGASGIEVPVSAVFSPPEASSQSSYVWVLDGEPITARRREVTVLDTTPRGVRVQGLSSGERIATAGVHYLREGQQARVIDQDS